MERCLFCGEVCGDTCTVKAVVVLHTYPFHTVLGLVICPLYYLDLLTTHDTYCIVNLHDTISIHQPRD